jgi:hypothetical protein
MVHDSHSSFCEEVFSLCEVEEPSRLFIERGRDASSTFLTSRMRWSGRIFWLLAFEDVESL